MSFEWLFVRPFLTIFMVLLCTLGCARENIRDNQPINVELKGQGECVASIGEQLSLYADGKMTLAQVESFWDCLSSAVNEFEHITAGDDSPDRYSPAALRRFLEKYFIRDHRISDDLLASIMELKRVLLSGTSQALTRQELQNLQDFIAELKSLSLTLHPHVGILFGQVKGASDVEIRAASAAAQSVLNQLGTWLYGRQQSYTFAQLEKFLTALNEWLGAGGHSSSTFSALQRSLSVVPAAKLILIGGDQTAIDRSEWLRLSSSLGKVFNFYLVLSHSFEGDINLGFTNEAMPESLDEVVDVLSQSVSAHQEVMIPLSEWRALFEKLEATTWLPSQFTATALQNAFVWLLKRPLGGGMTEPNGFTLDHVASLRHFFGDWLALLRSPSPILNRPGSKSVSAPIVSDFQNLLGESVPMEWDSLSRMVFNAQPPAQWSPRDRRFMVFPFVLLKRLKDSYTAPNLNYLTQDQMDLAVNEVLPLLHGFGWLLDSKPSLSKSRFREADLFTLSSNGDGRLDLGEAVRYTAFILSAYVAADHWLHTADRLCGSDRQADCVRALALDAQSDLLNPYPRLKASLSRWGPTRFFKFIENAEVTIIGKPASGRYALGDLLQVLQLIEYVEVFVQRFDGDHTDTIQLDEARRAFVVYGPILTKLLAAGGVPDSEVYSFFTFLMKYGDTPFTMFGGQIAYENWQRHKDSWQLNVERDTLMSILARLSKL